MTYCRLSWPWLRRSEGLQPQLQSATAVRQLHGVEEEDLITTYTSRLQFNIYWFSGLAPFATNSLPPLAAP